MVHSIHFQEFSCLCVKLSEAIYLPIEYIHTICGEWDSKRVDGCNAINCIKFTLEYQSKSPIMLLSYLFSHLRMLNTFIYSKVFVAILLLQLFYSRFSSSLIDIVVVSLPRLNSAMAHSSSPNFIFMSSLNFLTV